MKVVTFGELMVRLQPFNYERFVQANNLEFSFGGGEANVAVSLANYGLGIGTVLAAFTMGKGIAIVGNAMDKHIAIAPYITNHIKHHGSHKAQYAGH